MDFVNLMAKEVGYNSMSCLLTKLKSIPFNQKENLKKRAVMIFALIPLVSLLFICNTIYYEIANYNKVYSTTVQELEQSKLQSIDTIILENKNHMRVQNTYIINQMLYKFANEYNGDYNILDKDIDTLDEHSSVYIIYNNLLDYDNDQLMFSGRKYIGESLFIANKNGIIINSSSYGKRSFVRWAEYTQNFKNKELANNTIRFMVARPEIDNVLFWESKDIIEPRTELTEFTQPNLVTINNIISKYGIEGLRDYDLLVPTYISTPQFHSNKLVVVREANLYAVIKPYLGYIKIYDDIIDGYKENIRNDIILKIITCLVISGFLICSFVFCLFVVTGYCCNRRHRNNDTHVGGDTDDS